MSQRIDRRTLLRLAAAGWLAPRVRVGAEPSTLYNGIRLAQPWPPQRHGFSADPVLPPYLVDRPTVVPIDVGRQLFVDDFLIEETALVRTFHHAEYFNRNPVLWPSEPWEKRDEYAERTKTRSNPTAMPFSDGVFYDPAAGLFKMWYMGGYSQNTCYATSPDGKTWTKAPLDVVKGTNIVSAGARDSSTVWLDPIDRDASRRFKMGRWHDHHLELLASHDGIHWREVGRTGITGDRTTFFYNPFRQMWVYSLRSDVIDGNVRFRRYWETPDLFSHVDWAHGDPVLWASADSADPRRPGYNVPVELYTLDCVAYESILLGLFTMFRGETTEREKPNDICVGYSRDGFHWYRPDRTPFLGVSEQIGAWNWANVQSAGGCCLVVGDTLYFYVSGRRGVPGTGDPGVCSTGLATLRRDGFASMALPDPRLPHRVDPTVPPGTLTTRPLRFGGRHLFVNADVRSGALRVEVLDRDGRVLPQFAIAECSPVRGDDTAARVTWTSAGDLDAVAGDVVRFRFHLTGGRLYSFWVSPTPNGASGGYVAAGGPGFTGISDTIGAHIKPRAL